MRKQIRLGFHYHIPAIQRGNSIYMPAYLGVFIDSLAHQCKTICCYAYTPRPDVEEQMDYRIEAPNVTLFGLGPQSSIIIRLLRSVVFKTHLIESLTELDLFLLRAPTLLVHLFNKCPIPTAILLIGDFPSNAHLNQLSLLSNICNRIYYKWMKHYQLKVIKTSMVIAAGESLYNNLKAVTSNIAEVTTTTLSTKDIYSRNDTCEDDTINLLFAGRFDRSKGLFELYNALSQLKDSGNKYSLFLVGWPSKGDTILEELKEYAEKLGIRQMVVYLGYKQLGQELFDVYKKADIFVMPTKYDSFPRTITEAMSQSLPVVATKVGAIPLRLTDGLNAILVEPGDGKALANAINKVANDKQLRQKLIKEGRELASQNTLEIQSTKLITELEKYLNTNNE